MSEKNLYENEDPSWRMHMQMLTMRKRNMEIAQTIDEALYQYYTIERGKPVPNWRYIKDQDWWQEYLKSLGIDPRNP
jgi:hypothetical protein